MRFPQLSKTGDWVACTKTTPAAANSLTTSIASLRGRTAQASRARSGVWSLTVMRTGKVRTREPGAPAMLMGTHNLKQARQRVNATTTLRHLAYIRHLRPSRVRPASHMPGRQLLGALLEPA